MIRVGDRDLAPPGLTLSLTKQALSKPQFRIARQVTGQNHPVKTNHLNSPTSFVAFW